MNWELKFLWNIQDLRTPFLDRFFVCITHLGDAGVFWIIALALMYRFKQYRWYAVFGAVAMVVCSIIGNLILKNCTARVRPYEVAGFVDLLIKKPWDYSFPSGHTMHSFCAAVIIAMGLWQDHRVIAMGAIVLATCIAFSRMYLFVHYPTDIIGGLMIGVGVAFITVLVMKPIFIK